MATGDQPGQGWTVVLRRQPARMLDGKADGGYTDLFEIICCDCGDDPDLDYRDVSPRLQLIRGPCPLRDGVAAYNQHPRRHHTPAPHRVTAGEHQVIVIGASRWKQPGPCGSTRQR